MCNFALSTNSHENIDRILMNVDYNVIERASTAIRKKKAVWKCKAKEIFLVPLLVRIHRTKTQDKKGRKCDCD